MRERRRHPGKRRRAIWVVAIVVLAAMMFADHRGWLLVKRTDDLGVYHGARARVVRVIDGAAIEIELPDALHDEPLTRVDLWGIDCPDPDYPHGGPQPGASEATAHTTALVDGSTVLLRLEPQRVRGSFGRVLAHVELLDGRNVSEELLRAGLARVNERWPHAFLTRYAQAERSARRSGLGIWAAPPARAG